MFLLPLDSRKAEEMSDLQKRLQLSKLPPMPPTGVGGHGRGGKKGYGRGKRSYSPVSWQKYFTNMKDVNVDGDTFRVYENGTSGPVCLFLHGGGYSALTWALLTETLQMLSVCRCTAFDSRGHGDTYTADDTDLSAETQAKDVANLVTALYGDCPPPIVMVGHSMGGAVAVHAAANNLIPSLIGLCVIDVVEGTALDALNSMQSFLRGRPSQFNSLEHAIEWCVRSGQVRNLDSAKVSMVGQMKRIGTDETATSVVQHQAMNATPSSSDIIEEEEEDAGMSRLPEPSSNDEFKHPEDSPTDGYTWRIDLSKTEPYWRGWFEGLSTMFLSCSVPKVLLLAGVDRLDKDLMVGQMQGKFQMQVLPQCGHCVQEDVPDKVADALANYLIRHRFAEPGPSYQRPFPGC